MNIHRCLYEQLMFRGRQPLTQACLLEVSIVLTLSGLRTRSEKILCPSLYLGSVSLRPRRLIVKIKPLFIDEIMEKEMTFIPWGGTSWDERLKANV